MLEQQAESILHEMKQSGIRLWLEDEQLRYATTQQPMTENLLNKLKASKEEIIFYLKNAHTGTQQEPPSIIDRTKNILASSIQQQLWFMNSLTENGHAQYNITVVIKIEGDLVLEKLENALQKVFDRHEALRTFFFEHEGQVFQHVLPQVKIPLSFLEISNLEEKQTILNKQAQHIFDLSQAPLAKLLVLKISDKQFELALTVHHIIADGQSIQLFFNELTALYQERTDLKEHSLEYIDFSEWQRKNNRHLYEKQKAYWSKMLNPLPVLEFPLDNHRPPIQTFDGKYLEHPLEIHDSTIKHWLTKHGILTAMPFWLAAYAIFLYKYTYQTSPLIGIPISLRKHPAFENTFGMFSNSLPVRVDLHDEDHFIDLVKKIQKQLIALQENADTSLGELAKELLPHRASNHSAFFQTMLMLEENIPAINTDKLKFSIEGFNTNIAKFDISFAICQTQDKKNCLHIEYNVGLFNENSIKRMAEHFKRLAETLIQSPNQPIAQINFLSEHEKNFLLFDVNDTQKAFNENIQLQELLEQSVRNDPNQIAVTCQEKTLSYFQLNELSNQCAHYLMEHHVGPNVTVGIMMDRSIEAAIAFFGVLKAGGCFIPLDPEYPESRSTYSLKDAKAKVLITKQKYHHKVSAELENILLLDEYDVLSTYPKVNPTRQAGMDDLAYIIYTSGSTGNPKGVMISHLNISHYIQWAVQYYGVSDGVGAPVHSSLAFDLTITSIFAPLTCGKRIDMISDELGLQGLIDAVTQETHYSLIKLTPAHLKLLQTTMRPETLSTLHATIVIGGEGLYADDVAYWKKHGKNMRFINEYGATETSVADTVYELGDELPKTNSIPIGKAIDNSQMYVLDKNFNPVPIGVIGEIYLSGIGVAKGYLNLPEKTAEKFLAHPFFPHEKIYRTGDLGRVLENGDVEFMGRIDHQVKLKGYRVELGEIEAALEKLDMVKQAAVKVWRDETHHNELVAYVVPSDETLDKHQLRQALKAQLPDYMLPTAIVSLSEIPLTINGKVNTAALPKPQAEDFAIRSHYVAPSNDREKMITHIWAEIFGIKEVSIYDNFFALGGDSILSIQFASKMRDQGWRVTTKQIFSQQTAMELAQVIQPIQKQSLANQATLSGYCPLLPAQEWFLQQAFAEPNYFNQSFVLNSRESINIPSLKAALLTVITHHDALRLSYTGDQQTYCPKPHAVEDYFLTVDLPAVNLEEQMLFLKNQCQHYQAQLDISKGLNLKAILFKGALDHIDRLALIIHHWVIDGVSWKILIEDLQATYQNKLLPEKTNSILDWHAATQQASLSSLMREEDDYLKMLHFGVHYLFPTLPQKSLLEYRQSKILLSKEDTHLLLEQAFSISGQSKINAFLLTAYGIALAKTFSEDTFLIELESHGRQEFSENVDLSRTIGWFTQLYPISANIKKNSIEKTLLNIFSHLLSLPSNLMALNQKTHQLKPKVGFNYLGQFSHHQTESLFQISQAQSGEEISSKNHAWHLINLNAWIVNDQLELALASHPDLLDQRSFNQFSRALQTSFKTLIQYLTSEEIILDILPTTSCQKLMWDASQKAPGTYWTSISWTISKTHFDVYQKAWDILFKEYPILKSTFMHVNQTLFQITSHRYLPRWNGRTHPLMSFHDAEHGDDQIRVTWRYHHALLDGWSMPILLKRLETIYQALKNHLDIPKNTSPNLSGYYQWLKHQDTPESENFWKMHLDSRKNLNTLTADPKSIKPLYLDIETELYKKLEKLAASKQMTVASILQFAWGKTLADRSSTETVCFASITSGRSAEVHHVTHMIGMLMQIIPIQWTYHKNDFSNETLTNFNQYLLKAQEYSTYDWTEEMKPSIESMVVYENYTDSHTMMNMDIESLTHFPLTLVGLPKKNYLTLAIQYDSLQYSLQHVKKMLANLKKVLTELSHWTFETATEQSNQSSKKLIISKNLEGNLPPLCLVHPGSSGAEAYIDFMQHLPENLPFHIIDSHNLNTENLYLHSIEDMAKHYIQALKQVQASGPYYLGGWSLGGLIAYEIARQLIQSGERVNHLHLIDSFFPNNHHEDLGNTLYQLMQYYLDDGVSQYLQKEELIKRKKVAAIESQAIANYAPKGSLLIESTLYKASVQRPFPKARSANDSHLENFLRNIRAQKDNHWSTKVSSLEVIAIDAHHHNILHGNTGKKIMDFILKKQSPRENYYG